MEYLPRDVNEEILSYLPYESRIALSRVSKNISSNIVKYNDLAMFIKNNYIYMYQFISGLNPDDDDNEYNEDKVYYFSRDDEYSMDFILNNEKVFISMTLYPSSIDRKMYNTLDKLINYSTTTTTQDNDVDIFDNVLIRKYEFNIPFNSPYPIIKLLFQTDPHLLDVYRNDGVDLNIFISKNLYYLFGFNIKDIRVFFSYIKNYINFDIPILDKDLTDILRIVILNDKINIYNYTYI